MYSTSLLSQYTEEVTEIFNSVPQETDYSNNLSGFPLLSDTDIYHYFMVKCDGSRSTAQKHQKNGWKFYRSGKILQTLVKSNCTENKSCYVIKSTIEASFDKGTVTGITDKRYDVLVAVEKLSGTLLGGKCLCKAGKGGFCKHIAATVYHVKDYQDRGKDFLPKLLSRTSKGKKWHRPKVIGNTCVKIESCDFSGFDYEKETKHKTEQRLKRSYNTFQACPEGDNCVTQEKIQRLASSLRALGQAHQFVEILECNNCMPVKKKIGQNLIGASTSGPGPHNVPLDSPPMSNAQNDLHNTNPLESGTNQNDTLNFDLSQKEYEFYYRHVHVHDHTFM